MTRVTVVHIINSLSRGGAERAAVEMLVKLNPGRYRAEVICLYEDGELAPDLRAAGIPVRSLELPRDARLVAVQRLQSTLRRLRPDIVHTHLPESSWFGLPAALLARVPVRISHLQNTHPGWSLKLRLLDRVTASCSHHSLACSEAVRRYHVERVHYAVDRVTVLYNPTDVAGFRASAQDNDIRRELDLGASAPLVACVASLTPQKGHADLFNAMAIVVRDHPDAILLIVGEGALRDDVEALAVQLGIMSNVRFLGSRPDVPSILSSADLFVLASHWEGLGLVLVEAAAMEVPVVATRVDGIPEVVIDGVTGSLVPAGDPVSFAEAMKCLLGRRDERLRMGAAAHERALALFDSHTAACHLEALYQRLLAGRQS